jgi:hypothetical protein
MTGLGGEAVASSARGPSAPRPKPILVCLIIEQAFYSWSAQCSGFWTDVALQIPAFRSAGEFEHGWDWL